MIDTAQGRTYGEHRYLAVLKELLVKNPGQIDGSIGVDPGAAAGMARDFVAYWRAHMRPDGIIEAWEWANPDTGENSNPLYVASIALPYLSLKEAGLLNKEGGRP